MEEEDKGNDTEAPQPSPSPSPKASTVDAKGEPINLRVASQDGNEVFFRIRTNTPLHKLFDAYCDRQSVARGSVRFMFDGERIGDNETPATLDMEDSDVIDAMLQQVGG